MRNRKNNETRAEWLAKRRGINETSANNRKDVSSKTEKEIQREEIDRQTEEFLERGGEIEKVPIFKTGLPNIQLTVNQRKRTVGKKSEINELSDPYHLQDESDTEDNSDSS